MSGRDRHNICAMQIDIQATNLELTPSLREFIEGKVSKIRRLLRMFDDSALRARVEIARSTRHHKHSSVLYHAEVNLYFPGGMLRAEHDDEDLRKAINSARKTLEREIRKYKTAHT